MQQAMAKKKLIKSSVLAGVIVVIAIVIFAFFTSYKHKKEQALEQLEAEKMGLLVRYSKSKEDYEKLIKDYALYQDYPEHKKAGNSGLTLSAERIRALRKIMEPLQEKYFIHNLNISLTPVESLDARIQNRQLQAVTLWRNTININFQSFTDELAFSFLQDVSLKISGFTTFENLTITRDSKNNLSMDVNTPECNIKADINWVMMKENS